MKIGKGNVLIMVDSGATHNFMSEDIARNIGLKFIPVQDQMKAVNSPPDFVIGVAEKVDVTLGEWKGKVDFIVVQINDYEVVLGMEFMKKFEAIMVPHMKKLYIYDRQDEVPIGVPTIGATTFKCKLKTMNVEDVK